MFKPVVTVTLMTLFFTGIFVPKSVAEKRLIRLMRKLSVIMALVAFAVMIFLSQKVNAEKNEGTIDTQQLNRYEKMNQERAHDKNLRFTFFGKVIDLDGNPVQNAKVTMRLTSVPVSVLMDDQKLVESFTDANGRFAITEEGFQLYLVSLEREGYEYRFQYNPERGFNFNNGVKKAEIGQLSDQPVVFKVRKRGHPTFILSDGAQLGLRSGDVAFFDLLWQQWCYPNRLLALPYDYKGWHPDLKVSVEGDQKGYRLVLDTLDADTGILLDERELYEAPAQGYRPKIVLPPIGIQKGITTFVYLRGRGEKFYTRIKIEAGADEKKLSVHLHYTTNPNGERSFEASPELVQQYSKDVSSGKRRPYGYDPTAKPYTIEDVRKLLGK